MDGRIVILGTIIVLAGFFGGFAAYLTDPASARKSGEARSRRALMRFIVLGIIASACVPLFLSLIQSGLVGKIFSGVPGQRTGSSRQPFEEYLTFVGLCLLAAISARRFLDSLSRQILKRIDNLDEQASLVDQRVRQTEQKAQNAEATAQTAAEVVDEQDATEQPLGVGPGLEADADAAPALSAAEIPPVGDEERSALKSLANLSFRTATGIARDIGMPRNQIGELLESLAEKNLITREISPKTGVLRWRITPLGGAALSKPAGP
jgi:YLATT-like protein